MRHVEALASLLDHQHYHLNLLRFNWTDTGFSARIRQTFSLDGHAA